MSERSCCEFSHLSKSLSMPLSFKGLFLKYLTIACLLTCLCSLINCFGNVLFWFSPGAHNGLLFSLTCFCPVIVFVNIRFLEFALPG